MSIEEPEGQKYEQGKPTTRDARTVEFCSYCGSLGCGCDRLIFRRAWLIESWPGLQADAA